MALQGPSATSHNIPFTARFNLTGYAFAAPAFILMVIILIVPVLVASWLSFTDYSLGNKTFNWVSFENYSKCNTK